jgi:hypothetical protein
MYRVISQIGTETNVPALPLGAIGWDIDTKTMRIGDGTSSPPRLLTDKSSGNFDFSNVGITFSNALVQSLSTPGSNGWVADLALVEVGERVLMKVVDWTGGTGTKPPVDVFLTPSGLNASSSTAVNLKGPKGPPGSPPIVMFRLNSNGELIIEQDDTTLTRPVTGEINVNGDLVIEYGAYNGTPVELNMGKVVVTHKGPYNAAAKYEPLDEVFYAGSTYRVKYNTDPPIGTSPTDDTYWIPINLNSAGLHQMPSKTRAELLAISAVDYKGSMALCTDATGGAGIAYARGDDATDWVMVRDDSDI